MAVVHRGRPKKTLYGTGPGPGGGGDPVWRPLHQPAAEAIVASVAAKHDRRVASLMLAMDACEAAAMA